MSIIDFAVALTAVLSCVLLVWRFVVPVIKRLNRMLDWQEQFRRDWQGEPARPGRDVVFGVMERLNRLDGELSRNGGTSVKDVLEKTQRDVQHLAKRVNKIEEHQVNLNKIVLEHLVD